MSSFDMNGQIMRRFTYSEDPNVSAVTQNFLVQEGLRKFHFSMSSECSILAWARDRELSLSRVSEYIVSVRAHNVPFYQGLK